MNNEKIQKVETYFKNEESLLHELIFKPGIRSKEIEKKEFNELLNSLKYEDFEFMINNDYDRKFVMFVISEFVENTKIDCNFIYQNLSLLCSELIKTIENYSFRPDQTKTDRKNIVKRNDLLMRDLQSLEDHFWKKDEEFHFNLAIDRYKEDENFKNFVFNNPEATAEMKNLYIRKYGALKTKSESQASSIQIERNKYQKGFVIAWAFMVENSGWMPITLRNWKNLPKVTEYFDSNKPAQIYYQFDTFEHRCNNALEKHYAEAKIWLTHFGAIPKVFNLLAKEHYQFITEKQKA